MIYHDKKFNDPGHGWLVVPIKRLVKFGIADKISSFSYMRGIYAYLEEDDDATLYIDTLRQNGHDIKIANHYGNRESRIRNYDCYQKQKIFRFIMDGNSQTFLEVIAATVKDASHEFAGQFYKNWLKDRNNTITMNINEDSIQVRHDPTKGVDRFTIVEFTINNSISIGDGVFKY